MAHVEHVTATVVIDMILLYKDVFGDVQLMKSLSTVHVYAKRITISKMVFAEHVHLLLTLTPSVKLVKVTSFVEIMNNWSMETVPASVDLTESTVFVPNVMRIHSSIHSLRLADATLDMI